MEYPIGMIPFINMAPYRELGAPAESRFVPTLPSDSIAALAEGRIWAAAVPVGGLPLLGDIVEPVGMYGIAAKGECMSVMFFSHRPFARMDAACRIRLTPESASSVRLLYLLLGYEHGFGNLPGIVSTEAPCDGRLIIGDKALAALLNPGRHILGHADGTEALGAEPLHVTDLARQWHQVHGLPFVFARWVVRRDAPEVLKRHLDDWLSAFREKEPHLVERSLGKSARASGFPAGFVRKYFQVIRRSLCPEDLEGQKTFLEEFRRYRREPLFDAAP